jgi:excisionase family DNA binding protein
MAEGSPPLTRTETVEQPAGPPNLGDMYDSMKVACTDDGLRQKWQKAVFAPVPERLVGRSAQMSEWLTIQEAMQRLKISRATIYRWAKAGRLTIHQLGPRSPRIGREDIERLEEEAPRLYGRT